MKAYYRRGAAHMALGKTKEARLDFKTVVKLKPSDKDAQSKLKECEKAIYAAAFSKAIEGEKRKPASETVDVRDMTVEESYTGPRYVSGKSQKKQTTWRRMRPAARSALMQHAAYRPEKREREAHATARRQRHGACPRACIAPVASADPPLLLLSSLSHCLSTLCFQLISRS